MAMNVSVQRKVDETSDMKIGVIIVGHDWRPMKVSVMTKRSKEIKIKWHCWFSSPQSYVEVHRRGKKERYFISERGAWREQNLVTRCWTTNDKQYGVTFTFAPLHWRFCTRTQVRDLEESGSQRKPSSLTRKDFKGRTGSASGTNAALQGSSRTLRQSSCTPWGS